MPILHGYGGRESDLRRAARRTRMICFPECGTYTLMLHPAHHRTSKESVTLPVLPGEEGQNKFLDLNSMFSESLLSTTNTGPARLLAVTHDTLGSLGEVPLWFGCRPPSDTSLLAVPGVQAVHRDDGNGGHFFEVLGTITHQHIIGAIQLIIYALQQAEGTVYKLESSAHYVRCLAFADKPLTELSPLFVCAGWCVTDDDLKEQLYDYVSDEGDMLQV